MSTSSSPTFLGIDIGTHQSKIVLVDESGTVIDIERSSHSVVYPKPGWAEHEIEATWWTDVAAASKQLAARNPDGFRRLAGVGTSAIGPALAPVLESGRPLRDNAILYGVDTRAGEQIIELRSRLGPSLLAKAGNDLSSQSVGPKILWLEQHEPGVFYNADRMVTATSLLVHRLTGAWVIDHLTAAMWTPLYDFASQRWADDMAWLVEPSRLATLAWATDIAGLVDPAASVATGIPEGVPVTCGTVDAAAEALSVGVREAGDVMLMYGSTAFILAVTASAMPGTGRWSTPFLEPGPSAHLAGMSTSGTLTQWLAGLFSDGTGHAEPDFGDLAARASRVQAGSDGLLLLPYFSGERSPIDDPGARGVLAGLTLQHRFEHLYRAVLESVGFGIRHMLEDIDLSATEPLLRAVGGGAASTHWPQIVCDITGIPQQVPTSAIGASFGGAILAAIGTGHLNGLRDAQAWVGPGARLEPNRDLQALYDDLFGQYKELYQATRPIVGELSRLSSTP